MTEELKGYFEAEMFEDANTDNGYVATEGRNQLAGYDEHLQDSRFLGDARRCPRHPHVKTSSDNGMFDAPCGVCEYEMDLDAENEGAEG